MPEKNSLDIPEFLRKQSNDRREAWDAARTPVAAPLPEIKLTPEQRWRKERDELYAQQAAEHYARLEQEANES